MLAETVADTDGQTLGILKYKVCPMKILFQHFPKVSLGHFEEPQLNCGAKNVLLMLQ